MCSLILADLCSRRGAYCFLNTNNPNDTNIFWHTDRTDHTDFVRGGALTGFLNTNNPNDTNIFYTQFAPIARILVRVRMLTWGLLNENNTNGINTDSIRRFVNTNCLCLVLEVDSLYFFSNYRKASFHCTQLSKRRQFFAAVHFFNLNSAAKILLSNLSPNLSAYGNRNDKSSFFFGKFFFVRYVHREALRCTTSSASS